MRRKTVTPYSATLQTTLFLENQRSKTQTASRNYVSALEKMPSRLQIQGTFHYIQMPMTDFFQTQEPILKECYTWQAWQLPGT